MIFHIRMMLFYIIISAIGRAIVNNDQFVLVQIKTGLDALETFTKNGTLIPRDHDHT